MSRIGTRSSPSQAERRPATSAPRFVRAPLPHHRPQIKGKATLRRGRLGWYLTYNFPVAFRLFEMGIIVPIPSQLTDGQEIDPALEGTQVDVVIRQYVNAARADEPGCEAGSGDGGSNGTEGSGDNEDLNRSLAKDFHR